jgi:hypothetical protein
VIAYERPHRCERGCGTKAKSAPSAALSPSGTSTALAREQSWETLLEIDRGGCATAPLHPPGIKKTAASARDASMGSRFICIAQASAGNLTVPSSVCCSNSGGFRRPHQRRRREYLSHCNPRRQSRPGSFHGPASGGREYRLCVLPLLGRLVEDGGIQLEASCFREALVSSQRVVPR